MKRIINSTQDLIDYIFKENEALIEMDFYHDCPFALFADQLRLPLEAVWENDNCVRIYMRADSLEDVKKQTDVLSVKVPADIMDKIDRFVEKNVNYAREDWFVKFCEKIFKVLETHRDKNLLHKVPIHERCNVSENKKGGVNY